MIADLGQVGLRRGRRHQSRHEKSGRPWGVRFSISNRPYDLGISLATANCRRNAEQSHDTENGETGWLGNLRERITVVSRSETENRLNPYARDPAPTGNIVIERFHSVVCSPLVATGE